VGGIAGPLAFAAAWATLGAGTAGYDPTRDAISRLAAYGAPTRVGMTAGLVALGAGMGLYGLALRPRPVWVLPVANGAVTLAVAAFALGGKVDAAHGAFAGLGYVTLAAIPPLVGRRPWSIVAGVVSGACLLLSAVVDRDGLFQRLGLTVAHAWIVVNSLRLLRSPTPPSTTPPAPARAGRRR
jgi:hypothetical protein